MDEPLRIILATENQWRYLTHVVRREIKERRKRLLKITRRPGQTAEEYVAAFNKVQEKLAFLETLAVQVAAAGPTPDPADHGVDWCDQLGLEASCSQCAWERDADHDDVLEQAGRHVEHEPDHRITVVRRSTHIIAGQLAGDAPTGAYR